jgi:hypothetical protein
MNSTSKFVFLAHMSNTRQVKPREEVYMLYTSYCYLHQQPSLDTRVFWPQLKALIGELPKRRIRQGPESKQPGKQLMCVTMKSRADTAISFTAFTGLAIGPLVAPVQDDDDASMDDGDDDGDDLPPRPRPILKLRRAPAAGAQPPPRQQSDLPPPQIYPAHNQQRYASIPGRQGPGQQGPGQQEAGQQGPRPGQHAPVQQDLGQQGPAAGELVGQVPMGQVPVQQGQGRHLPPHVPAHQPLMAPSQQPILPLNAHFPGYSDGQDDDEEALELIFMRHDDGYELHYSDEDEGQQRQSQFVYAPLQVHRPEAQRGSSVRREREGSAGEGTPQKGHGRKKVRSAERGSEWDSSPYIIISDDEDERGGSSSIRGSASQSDWSRGLADSSSSSSSSSCNSSSSSSSSNSTRFLVPDAGGFRPTKSEKMEHEEI